MDLHRGDRRALTLGSPCPALSQSLTPSPPGNAEISPTRRQTGDRREMEVETRKGPGGAGPRPPVDTPSQPCPNLTLPPCFQIPLPDPTAGLSPAPPPGPAEGPQRGGLASQCLSVPTYTLGSGRGPRRPGFMTQCQRSASRPAAQAPACDSDVSLVRSHPVSAPVKWKDDSVWREGEGRAGAPPPRPPSPVCSHCECEDHCHPP